MSKILDKMLPNKTTSKTSTNSLIVENCLINLKVLMHDEDKTVSEYDHAWFSRVNIAVREYTQEFSHDQAQNYDHCLRVVNNAYLLWRNEKHQSWAKHVNPMVVYTAALVHTYGFQEPQIPEGPKSVTIQTDEDKRLSHRDKIRDMLDACKCPPQVAGRASEMAAYISLDLELNDVKGTEAFSDEYPDLKIVQDADRLDALGHMGIVRAAADHKDGGMIAAKLDKLIEKRLKRYPDFMKTKTGKKEAERGLSYMVEFKDGLSRQINYEMLLRAG